METTETKDCPECQDEIYPDIEGDYFCMDCNNAYLINPHKNFPSNKWVRFKQ